MAGGSASAGDGAGCATDATVGAAAALCASWRHSNKDQTR